MEARYQHAQTDGHLDWTVGAKTFSRAWAPVWDQLRFHRGGFRIVESPGGTPGPLRTLAETDDVMRIRLEREKVGSVFKIRAESDSFALAMRKIDVTTGGDRVVDHAAAREGTRYIFGVTDCSWLSEASYAPEIDDDWVHNAHVQHLMFGAKPGYVRIIRDELKVGDLLFIDDDHHVAIYAGNLPDYHNYECVWDTEPHDTGAPPGWPTGNLQTGVRVRPMVGNYYCAWGNVNGIGRVVEVNGRP